MIFLKIPFRNDTDDTGSTITLTTKPYENPFYLSLSKKFRAVRYVCIVLLILFVMTMVTFWHNEITTENFKYLVKAINIDAFMPGFSHTSVRYESDSHMKFAIYQGDFAVLTRNKLTLIGSYGDVILSEEIKSTDPMISVSDEYMLVYGDSAGGYSLYNSFSKIKHEKTEYPVTLAKISDYGTYAIVTKTNDYRSAVYIYDKNGNLKTLIKKKDNYVTDVALSDDGRYALVVSFFTDDQSGEFKTEVLLYDIKNEKSIVKDYKKVFPLSASFKSDGFSVIFDNNIVFYNLKGEEIRKHDFSDAKFANATPYRFCSGKELTAILFEGDFGSYKNRIVLFNKNGEIIKETDFNGNVSKIATDDKYVYILASDTVYTFDIRGIIEETKIYKNPLDIVPIGRGDVFVCYSNRAFALSYLKSNLK